MTPVRPGSVAGRTVDHAHDRTVDCGADRTIDRTTDGTTDRGTDRRTDCGVATIWAATAVAVLIGVLVAMLDLATAVAARHRAEDAADLAALAAAGQAVRGAGAACARAEDVAAGNGGHVVLCRLQGWEVVVEVDVGVRLSMLGTVTVQGRARAGPATVDPPTVRPSDRPPPTDRPATTDPTTHPSGR